MFLRDRGCISTQQSRNMELVDIRRQASAMVEAIYKEDSHFFNDAQRAEVERIAEEMAKPLYIKWEAEDVAEDEKQRALEARIYAAARENAMAAFDIQKQPKIQNYEIRGENLYFVNKHIAARDVLIDWLDFSQYVGKCATYALDEFCRSKLVTVEESTVEPVLSEEEKAQAALELKAARKAAKAAEKAAKIAARKACSRHPVNKG